MTTATSTTATINDMINSNMLDYNMDLDVVRGVIDSVANDEIKSGIEQQFTTDELVAEYERINARNN